jgi:NADPH:quinone reductase-like Zn-dependent oxidoreductase
MRAIAISEGFGIDRLTPVQRSFPEELGGSEVLVRLHAASLNFRDLLMVEGKYNPDQTLPLVPCSDGAGVVSAVGSGGTGWRVGDRVMPCFAQGWVDGRFTPSFRHITLGGPLDGTLSTHILVQAEGLVRLPAGLEFVEGACLPCAALTAWSAIVEQGRIGRGDVVVIQGTGGVALAALQFASALGSTTIVTSKSDQKLERARSLGASHTINYRQHPEWSRNVKELTGGVGADHVLELGGPATIRQSVRAVRGGGCVSMIGVLGGAVAELDLPLVVMRNVRLQGVTVGSRRAFERMVEFIEENDIRPVVDRVFALEDSASAFRYLRSAAHFGKICIDIA